MGICVEEDQLEELLEAEYMGSEQKEFFFHLLNDWKQKLEKEANQVRAELKEREFYTDFYDSATYDEQLIILTKTTNREHKLIKKINKSLQDLRANEYGFCEDCDGEIGVKRLIARPTATKCIDCKTIAEVREAQYYDGV